MRRMASETLMQSLELKFKSKNTVVNTKKKLINQEKLERFLFMNGSKFIILNLDRRKSLDLTKKKTFKIQIVFSHNYWLEMLLVEVMWQHYFICIIIIYK